MGFRKSRIKTATQDLIDSHYHLEAAANPTRVAESIESNRILTVAVTSLPRTYEAMRGRVSRYRYIRPALGLHPLLAAQNAKQLELFDTLKRTTSFIGEIGLDFSREGRSSRQGQIAVFRALLESVRGLNQFMTVHSRGAEAAVLDLVQQVRVGPVVFHWYSGPLGVLDELLAVGHYCSVNPAMIRSAKGRQIVARIPPARALTETDGPYVSGRSGAATPSDVALVVDYLSSVWSTSPQSVDHTVQVNFRRLLPSRSTSDRGHEAIVGTSTRRSGYSTDRRGGRGDLRL